MFEYGTHLNNSNMEKFFIVVIRGMLRFDRYVLKRYFNIETPLYRCWWKAHVKKIQQQIDQTPKGDLVLGKSYVW